MRSGITWLLFCSFFSFFLLFRSAVSFFFLLLLTRSAYWVKNLQFVVSDFVSSSIFPSLFASFFSLFEREKEKNVTAPHIWNALKRSIVVKVRWEKEIHTNRVAHSIYIYNIVNGTHNVIAVIIIINTVYIIGCISDPDVVLLLFICWLCLYYPVRFLLLRFTFFFSFSTCKFLFFDFERKMHLAFANKFCFGFYLHLFCERERLWLAYTL